MTYEMMDWELEAKRLKAAFEIDEECEFFVQPPEWHDIEAGEIQNTDPLLMTPQLWINNSTQYTSPRTNTVPSVTTRAGNKKNWVWHHHQDMKHMQLVPSVLNTPTFGGVFHQGGATWAEKARW